MRKSNTMKQLARKRGVKFVDVPMSAVNPDDLRGFPVADPQMQASAYQVVLDRKVGDYKLGGNQ